MKSAFLLEKPFDPSRLGPGVYLAASNSPAYGLLRAMIAAGAAKQVGESYEPDGVVVLTAKVRGQGSVVPNAIQQMQLSRRFFVNALADYRDWKEKWWRECVQNSVDAGAKRIDLQCLLHEENSSVNPGECVVRCWDDGRGMSVDTILKKFLVFGETTKTGEEGAAGGFGKAKELLILPWISWRIVSNGQEVRGVGNEYDDEIRRVPEPEKGTMLEVVMPESQRTTEGCAISYVKKCHLPAVAFTVNGDPYSADLTSGKLLRDFGGKAGLHYNKQAKVRGMLVRAKGLYMFSRYLPSEVPGAVVVDLKRPSTELLTANRDGFADQGLAEDIDRFSNELAADVMSALKKKAGLIKEKFKGAGKIVANEAEMGARLKAPVLPELPRGKEAQIDESDAAAMAKAVCAQWEGKKKWVSPEPAALAAVVRACRIIGQSQYDAMLRQMAWQPDFYLMNEIEGFRVPKKFRPGSMPPSVLKLIKSWAELCRYVLIQLCCKTPFGVGFHFSTSAAASYFQDEDDDEWLMLNPFVDLTVRRIQYGPIWNPNKHEHLKWLYASAIHECTHMADGVAYHSEAFSSAFTKNVGICADGFRFVKRIVGGIRTREAVESEETSDVGDEQ